MLLFEPYKKINKAFQNDLKKKHKFYISIGWQGKLKSFYEQI